MVAASLRALLAGSIDYAGLFPPASLELEPSLRNYAQYLQAPESWMLGAFVLPVKKFADAARLHSLGKNELRVSALGPKTENPKQFIDALATTAETIRSSRSSMKVAQIEMELPVN